MESRTDFLKMYILSSGLITDKKELGFMTTYLGFRREFGGNSQEVTFQDFINFASGKMSRGLKNTAIHKRVFNTMIDIFKKNEPEYVALLEKCLPEEETIEI